MEIGDACKYSSRDYPLSGVNLSVPSEELENRVFSEIQGRLNVELGLAH
jgi:hypothetical protein